MASKLTLLQLEQEVENQEEEKDPARPAKRFLLPQRSISFGRPFDMGNAVVPERAMSFGRPPEPDSMGGGQ